MTVPCRRLHAFLPLPSKWLRRPPKWLAMLPFHLFFFVLHRNSDVLIGLLQRSLKWLCHFWHCNFFTALYIEVTGNVGISIGTMRRPWKWLCHFTFSIRLVVHRNDCAMGLFQLVYRVLYTNYWAMFAFSIVLLHPTSTIEKTVCLTVTWIIFMEVGNIIMLYND